jgi:hypothetical protein
MPEMPKPNPFNNNFAEKEPSYNDKMSQTNPPVLVPLADKTIEMDTQDHYNQDEQED